MESIEPTTYAAPVANASVENVIRLTLHNRDMWRGGYDSADDWDITSYGRTLDEAIVNMIPSYIHSGIEVDGHDIDVITRILWNKDYWYNEEHEHQLKTPDGKPVKSYQEIVEIINEHPNYIKQLEKNAKLEAEKQRLERKEMARLNRISNFAAKKQTKADELAKLKELKEKYPNE